MKRKRRVKKVPTKSNNYIEFELQWLEQKALELKEYVDSNPLNKLKDRIVGKRVTANIEQQAKCIRDTLQDYARLIEAIDKLREHEATKKITTRGDLSLSPMETGEI